MDDLSIDIDAIIAIIAKKHKIIIGEQDPILAVATINEYVIDHYYKKADIANETLINTIEKLHFLVARQANEDAEKIINASLRASKELLDKNTKSLIKSLRAELESNKLHTEQKYIKALKTSNLFLIVSSILFLVGCLAVALS